MKERYFSIVIPAHNEEKYIGNTLRHALSQNYPAELFEVIVVENGSTDRTLREIRAIRSRQMKSFSTMGRGISLAKNFGAKKANKNAEWIIFLDADTLLRRDFLRETNDYLEKYDHKKLAIGTAKLLPIESGFAPRFWFAYYNLIHKCLGMSASVQIARKSVFDRIGYDEKLGIQEDLKLIKQMRKHGRFFYISTNRVFASARRFQMVGGFKLTWEWFLASMVPYRNRTKREYAVVR